MLALWRKISSATERVHIIVTDVGCTPKTTSDMGQETAARITDSDIIFTVKSNISIIPAAMRAARQSNKPYGRRSPPKNFSANNPIPYRKCVSDHCKQPHIGRSQRKRPAAAEKTGPKTQHRSADLKRSRPKTSQAYFFPKTRLKFVKPGVFASKSADVLFVNEL